MRRLYLIPLLVLFTHAVAEAQSGCCSHHGGVCNCACCDGTPLSDICRPYFPCSGGDTKPKAPSLLTAGATSSTQCFLTWLDNSSNETSFRLEAKTEAQAFFQPAGSVGANVTSTTVGGLAPGTKYFFRVRAHNADGDSSYSNEATATTPLPPGAACQAPAICFNKDRFRIDAQWKTPAGASGRAAVVRLTEESGYLWFFAASNVEVVFKVINGCGLNHAYWFFAGGLTNVQTTITVTDTLRGTAKTYTNPQGRAFQPIQDTSAFATCP